MKNYPDKTFKRAFSLKHVFALVYLFALAGLLGWVNVDMAAKQGLMVLASEQGGQAETETTLIRLEGKIVGEKLRGYFSESSFLLPEPSWNILGGTSIRAMTVKGSLALTSGYLDKLISIDLSEPSVPQVMGSIQLRETITSIVMVGNRAAVGMSRKGGVAIVDLRDPGNMNVAAYLETGSSVHNMVAVGDQVYYSDSNHGVGRIDMASEAPRAEIIFKVAKPWKLSGQDNLLAVGTLNGSLMLLDISSPGAIRLIASKDFSRDDKGHIRGVAFSGNSLVVALANKELFTFAIDGGGLLDSLSATTLPGVPYHMLTVEGSDRLAISLVGSGLVLADLHSGGQLGPVSHLAMPTTVLSLMTAGGKIYLSGLGDFAGISAFELERIRNYDFAEDHFLDHQHRSLVSSGGAVFGYGRDKTLLNLSNQKTVDLQGLADKLFVQEDNGIAIFELSKDATELIRTGSYVGPSRPIDIIKRDEWLFLLHSDGLDVYSGSSFDKKELVSSLDVSGWPVTMAALDDSHILLVTKYEGLKVVDISAPAFPKVLSQLVPPTHLQGTTIGKGLVVHGQVAYVAQGAGGVYAVDVRRPEDIRLLQIVDTPGVAKELVIKDDLLLVADGDQGVFLIDVSHRSQPAPVGSLPTPISVKDIACDDDGILVSGHPGGTMRLELPRKVETFVERDKGELTARMENVSRSGFIYLYNENYRQRIPVELN